MNSPLLSSSAFCQLDTSIRRWDADTRTTCEWDGLRRDPQLWLTGECLIHLYSKGQSRRGPSFRIPTQAIPSDHWDTLFKRFSSRRYFFDKESKTNYSLNLYIPAPRNSSREDTFDWHMTTRNFFALCCNKPIVGNSLGQSLISLKRRLDLWSSSRSDGLDDMMKYMNTMGYLDFSHSPDYALGVLQFADYFQLDDLWIDSFSHCVGMHQILFMSTEFRKISHSIKAHIDSATDRLETHLQNVTDNLSNFLEHDLSSAYLGLAPTARAHLDRFRAFLHAFYVRKFGYWPPPRSSTFAKSLFQSMYFDFQHLYDYLVDLDSTNSIQRQKPASGGVCVLQNLQAFDERHHFEPLPHPNPRLPELLPIRRRSQSQRALQTLRISRSVEASNSSKVIHALSSASNATDTRVVNAPVVKAYREFEADISHRREEKVTITDARKVRWIMVYCTFQMLVSVTRAPSQVRDVHGPSYPLCCDVSLYPPWKQEDSTSSESSDISHTVMSSYSPTTIEEEEEEVSLVIQPDSPVTHIETGGYFTITPDCQIDNYNEHIQVAKTSSWRQTLSLRDQSVAAAKELERQSTSGEDLPASFHQRNRSYSMESANKSRLSSLLRHKSMHGTRPTSKRMSLVGSWAAFTSQDDCTSKIVEVNETLEIPVAESILGAPHTTPMRDVGTRENEYGFTSDRNDEQFDGTITEISAPNQSPRRASEQPRPPVPGLKTTIGNLKACEDMKSIVQQECLKGSPFRAKALTPRPKTADAFELKVTDSTARPKSAGKWSIRTQSEAPLKPSNSRRFTFGTWNTERHGIGEPPEGKRLRYSMLIKAI